MFEVWALATPTAQVRSGCVTCAHLITRSSAFRAKQKLQELFMNYHEIQYVSFWGRHCSITNLIPLVRIESATNLVLFSLPSHPTHTLLFLICNLSYTQHPRNLLPFVPSSQQTAEDQSECLACSMALLQVSWDRV